VKAQTLYRPGTEAPTTRLIHHSTNGNSVSLCARQHSFSARASDTIGKVRNKVPLDLRSACVHCAEVDSGRGFAIVADEVRKLATGSASATGSAATLIAESAQKTQAGMEIAPPTAQAFNAILSSSSEVSTLVAGIATASQQEASGIDKVSIGLLQIEASPKSPVKMRENSPMSPMN